MGSAFSPLPMAVSDLHLAITDRAGQGAFWTLLRDGDSFRGLIRLPDPELAEGAYSRIRSKPLPLTEAIRWARFSFKHCQSGEGIHDA